MAAKKNVFLSSSLESQSLAVYWFAAREQVASALRGLIWAGALFLLVYKDENLLHHRPCHVELKSQPCCLLACLDGAGQDCFGGPCLCCVTSFHASEASLLKDKK